MSSEDDKNKNAAGFAGLSSLVSDVEIDTDVAKSAPATPVSAKQEAPGEDQKSATSAQQSSQPQSKAQPYQAPTQPSDNSGWKWVLGIGAVIAVIWMAAGSGNKNQTSPSYSSSFGKKVGTVLDNGWERNYRTSDEGKTAGSDGMRASLDLARQSRDAFTASLQETEGHRQMWELSHNGQLGSNLQLQDHFIKDFLLPKLEYNYEKFQGVMGDPHKLRPYIEEYTAQNYDRMLGEMGGQVQGAEAIQARHDANRAGIPGRESVESAGGDYMGQVKGRAGRAGVTPQGRPSDQAMHTAMREFSRNAFEVNDREEGAGHVHQENATPSNFRKLKPASPVGKGMEVAEDVSDAASRVVNGVTGPNPSSYIQETIGGKNSK
jgi:hypothetical protein